MAFTIEGYTLGRTTQNGEPCPPRARYDVVMAVPSPEIERFMGCRRGQRLTEHLRELRDRGILICPYKDRLTGKLRGGRRAYIFACAERDVPRIRGARASRL